LTRRFAPLAVTAAALALIASFTHSSSAALAWLQHADMGALRRLQLGAEECNCWTVLFRPLSALTQSSPAALRVKLSVLSTGFAAHAGQARVEVLKCHGRRPQTFVIERKQMRDLYGGDAV
jgi:hypothetical protein